MKTNYLLILETSKKQKKIKAPSKNKNKGIAIYLFSLNIIIIINIGSLIKLFYLRYNEVVPSFVGIFVTIKFKYSLSICNNSFINFDILYS